VTPPTAVARNELLAGRLLPRQRERSSHRLDEIAAVPPPSSLIADARLVVVGGSQRISLAGLNNQLKLPA